MLNCKHAATSTILNKKLQQVNEEKLTDVRRFKSFIGGLIYLIHTRFDIAFSIDVIFRFMKGFHIWMITWKDEGRAMKKAIHIGSPKSPLARRIEIPSPNYLFPYSTVDGHEFGDGTVLFGDTPK